MVKYLLVLLLSWAGCCRCWALTDQNSCRQAIIEGNNDFAIELYGQLRSGQGNLVFSPYSISTALAMAYAGARGPTAREMAVTLNFPVVLPGGCVQTPVTTARPAGPIFEPAEFHRAFADIVRSLSGAGEKSGCELVVANAMWGQKGYGFDSSFLELVKTNYDGGLNEVDFVAAADQARIIINNWVEEKTRQKISELIRQGMLNEMTRLVLTNAIYFKGVWARQFEKAQTSKARFTLIDGRGVDCDMMRQTASLGYMEGTDVEVLAMPYAGQRLCMVIVLPKAADGLVRVEEQLSQERIDGWLAGLSEREVAVWLPKFTVTSEFSLADVLKTLGIRDAFSAGAADFSGINGRKDLFISAVVHKGFVQVDEQGTEAAAATGVVIGLTSVGPRDRTVFRADHPFLFLIRDNRSASILFIGRVMNPTL